MWILGDFDVGALLYSVDDGTILIMVITSSESVLSQRKENQLCCGDQSDKNWINLKNMEYESTGKRNYYPNAYEVGWVVYIGLHCCIHV